MRGGVQILSVVIGVAVPTVLPKAYTHYAAAALFAYFGVKLLREAHSMPTSGGGGVSEELAEVEQEMGLEPESKKEEAPLTGVTVVSDETAALTSPGMFPPLMRAFLCLAAAPVASCACATVCCTQYCRMCSCTCMQVQARMQT